MPTGGPNVTYPGYKQFCPLAMAAELLGTRWRTMSAFGGKADITRTCTDVRFWHKADIGGSGLLSCKLTPEPHFASRKFRALPELRLMRNPHDTTSPVLTLLRR